MKNQPLYTPGLIASVPEETTIKALTDEIGYLYKALAGETINGVRMGDSGCDEQWVRNNIAVRRQMLERKLVGRFARSIESGWLGKVVGLREDACDIFCKMKGVNMLCWEFAGGNIDDHLDNDDTRWFTPEDLQFVEVS